MTSSYAWLAIQLFVLRQGLATTLVALGLIFAGLFAAVTTHLRSAELKTAQARLVAPAHAQHLTAEQRALKPQKDNWQSFSTTLLPRRKVPDFLAMAWKTADANGIQASKADYRFEHDDKGLFTRMTIVMPVVGTYPLIKRYAFKLLAENASLALDRFELKRQRSGDAQIEAELHFVLFVSEP